MKINWTQIFIGFIIGYMIGDAIGLNDGINMRMAVVRCELFHGGNPLKP